VLVRLDPAFALADHVTFAAPELTYRRAADGQSALLANRVDSFRVNIGTDTAHVEQSRRDDVRARVLQVSTSLELTQSMQAYAEGDVNGARQRLEQQRRTLEAVAATSPTAAPALAREAQSLQKLVDQLGAQAPSSEGAQDIIKAEKARAFDLRR
jgi:hypothetical protein